MPPGQIQNSDSSKNLRNTQKTPRSTGPAFLGHPVQFFLSPLLVYFYRRDWWCRRITPISKQYSFLHHIRKSHYINFRYPLKASDLKRDPSLQHAISKKMKQMFYTYQYTHPKQNVELTFIECNQYLNLAQCYSSKNKKHPEQATLFNT